MRGLLRGGGGGGEGGVREGTEEKGGDVEEPRKWSAPGPPLALSGPGFDNVRHCLSLSTRTQISVCKSPFPSAGTAVSLFRVKTV